MLCGAGPGCSDSSGQCAASRFVRSTGILQSGDGKVKWLLAGGFFSGRFRRDNLDTFTEEYDQLAVKVYCEEGNFKRHDRVQELAADKGVTVPHVALAYVYNQPEGIHALSGARNTDEVHVNVEASEIKLSEGEIAYLELKA